MSNGKTDPSDGFPLPLGRDTDLTVEHWGRIAEAILPAPSICNGTYPRKSPGNARFISRRKRIQWIGCCVGEGVTGMAETSTRTPKSIDWSLFREDDDQTEHAKELACLGTACEI